MKATYKTSFSDSTEDIVETYLSLDYLRVNLPKDAHKNPELQHLYDTIMTEYLWCLVVLFHRAFTKNDESAEEFINEYKLTPFSKVAESSGISLPPQSG